MPFRTWHAALHPRAAVEELVMRGRSIRWMLCLVFAGLACLGWYASREQARAAAQPAAPKSAPAAVVAAVATESDVPIYVSGLGAAQAFNTVTIKARVDGQLEKVAFSEGQEVKAGDVIPQIDPHPLQPPLP